MPIAAAFVALITADKSIFDQSLQAFRTRKAFSVGIALDAKLNGKSTSARYKLAYLAPDKVLLTKIVEGQPAFIFNLNGTNFQAYDPAVKEVVVRKASGDKSVAARLASAMGDLEDPVKDQLSPDAMSSFFDQFRDVQGWVNQTRSGVIMLTRTAVVNNVKTFAELDFSASTKLLTRSLLVGKDSRLEWNFAYGQPPRSLAFKPPAGTKKVAALSEHVHIAASDPKARRVLDDSLRAYSRLTSIAYSVDGPEGMTENKMQGSTFWEKQARSEWSYEGGTFMLKDLASGKAYRGSCKPLTVLSYLKALRSPMDPILLALFTRRNPISSWVIPGVIATSHGEVSLGGVTAHAIELRSSRNEVSALIRSDNSLVSSVASRVKDPSGRLISDTHRQFSYTIVNKPIPASSFTVRADRWLPLSRIGK